MLYCNAFCLLSIQSVIDQSITTIQILKNTNKKVVISEKEVTIKHMCLWLIMKKKNKIQKISELNSLMFLIKLAVWRKEAINAGFIPSLKINYEY